MFGCIAVEKEVYACTTAQICVCLCIGEFVPQCESSDTRHNIFYSVKYFFLIHNYAVMLIIYSLTSVSSNSEIQTSIAKDGNGAEILLLFNVRCKFTNKKLKLVLFHEKDWVKLSNILFKTVLLIIYYILRIFLHSNLKVRHTLQIVFEGGHGLVVDILTI